LATRFAEQTWAPVAQEYVPVWHPLLMEHAPPAAQLQFPAPSQYWLPPQLVPAAAFPVMFVQACAPVAHEIVAVLHALLGVHAAPATQLQVPFASQ
jgi:hypothetical protein